MKKTLFMTTLFAAAAMFAADAAPSKTEIKDDFTAKVSRPGFYPAEPF